MLADLARRDGRPVLAFDLFGDLDLRASASRVVTARRPERARRRRGRWNRRAPSSTAPASRIIPRSSRGWPSGMRCWATRPRRCAPCATRSGSARRCATPGSRSRRSTSPADCASRCAAAAGRACATGAAASCRPGTYVQERIDGLACSAAAVGDGVDAVVLGLTEQLVGERAFGVRGYRWCGNLTPPRLPSASGGAAGAGARDLLAPGGRVRAAGAVRRRLHLGRRARVDARGQPAPDRVAGGDRVGVRRRRLRRAPARLRR